MHKTTLPAPYKEFYINWVFGFNVQLLWHDLFHSQFRSVNLAVFIINIETSIIILLFPITNMPLNKRIKKFLYVWTHIWMGFICCISYICHANTSNVEIRANHLSDKEHEEGHYSKLNSCRYCGRYGNFKQLCMMEHLSRDKTPHFHVYLKFSL